jgi:hypothetical protein
MVGETETFSMSTQKWNTVYAVAIFLTKKKFDFAKVASQCKNENVDIYAQGIHIHKISIDKFTLGTLYFLRDKKEQAFQDARTICLEKTDPDLRR